jgi:hypothetical protein
MLPCPQPLRIRDNSRHSEFSQGARKTSRLRSLTDPPGRLNIGGRRTMAFDAFSRFDGGPQWHFLTHNGPQLKTGQFGEEEGSG